jgi:hypothetical protein
MKLVYLGADVPSNRTILEAMGVREVGVSYWRLRQRGLPKTKPYLLSNYFSPFMNIHVHAGVPAGNSFTKVELQEISGEYEDFIANNLDRLTSFIELDHPQLTPEEITHQRLTAWMDPEPMAKFMPVWRPTDSFAQIQELADEFKDIAIPWEILEHDQTIAAKIRNLQNSRNSVFHGIACAKPDNLRRLPLETASTMSWISPMMRGETIVWDGRRLVRYPKKMKDQARPRYRQVYEKAGLDFDRIMDDDAIEVCKLALWSYEQFEDWLNSMTHNDGELSYNSEESDVEPFAETTPSVHDKKGSTMRKLEAREPNERGILPVFGVEFSEVTDTDSDGRQILSEIPVLRSSGVSLRQCNTCFVAGNCPAFKADSECAFSLPVELKTTEQLKALLTAVLEMQGQRIAFARFSEEMNGGYPDPNVSQEIDRLYKLVKTMKDLDTNREFIQITAERQTGGGVLSQIFGEKARPLADLPNNGYTEEQTTQIIQQHFDK